MFVRYWLKKPSLNLHGKEDTVARVSDATILFYSSEAFFVQREGGYLMLTGSWGDVKEAGGSSSFLQLFASAFPTTSLFCHARNILIGTQLCNLNQTPCCLSPAFSIIWFILVPKWLSSLLYHCLKSATRLSYISNTLPSSVGLKMSATQMQPLTFFGVYISQGLLLRFFPWWTREHQSMEITWALEPGGPGFKSCSAIDNWMTLVGYIPCRVSALHWARH